MMMRENTKILVISSSTARQPSDPNYASPNNFDKKYTGVHPDGFPKNSPSCDNMTSGTTRDNTAIEITIRKPSNTLEFNFNFDFYTYEWPNFICTQFNDFFVAILSPIPTKQTDNNINFDQINNPISVNNTFVQIYNCSDDPPCTTNNKTFTYPLDNTKLTNTNFENHATTN
jgi:hypothetical protein